MSGKNRFIRRLRTSTSAKDEDKPRTRPRVEEVWMLFTGGNLERLSLGMTDEGIIQSSPLSDRSYIVPTLKGRFLKLKGRERTEEGIGLQL